jgi:hypothetical protein
MEIMITFQTVLVDFLKSLDENKLSFLKSTFMEYLYQQPQYQQVYRKGKENETKIDINEFIASFGQDTIKYSKLCKTPFQFFQDIEHEYFKSDDTTHADFHQFKKYLHLFDENDIPTKYYNYCISEKNEFEFILFVVAVINNVLEMNT